MDYMDFYQSNADFRRYVDRECQRKNHGVEEELQEKITQLVGDMYFDKSRDDVIHP